MTPPISGTTTTTGAYDQKRKDLIDRFKKLAHCAFDPGQRRAIEALYYDYLEFQRTTPIPGAPASPTSRPFGTATGQGDTFKNSTLTEDDKKQLQTQLATLREKYTNFSKEDTSSFTPEQKEAHGKEIESLKSAISAIETLSNDQYTSMQDIGNFIQKIEKAKADLRKYINNYAQSHGVETGLLSKLTNSEFKNTQGKTLSEVKTEYDKKQETERKNKETLKGIQDAFVTIPDVKNITSEQRKQLSLAMEFIKLNQRIVNSSGIDITDQLIQLQTNLNAQDEENRLKGLASEVTERFNPEDREDGGQTWHAKNMSHEEAIALLLYGDYQKIIDYMRDGNENEEGMIAIYAKIKQAIGSTTDCGETDWTDSKIFNPDTLTVLRNEYLAKLGK